MPAVEHQLADNGGTAVGGGGGATGAMDQGLRRHIGPVKASTMKSMGRGAHWNKNEDQGEVVAREGRR